MVVSSSILDTECAACYDSGRLRLKEHKRKEKQRSSIYTLLSLSDPGPTESPAFDISTGSAETEAVAFALGMCPSAGNLPVWDCCRDRKTGFTEMNKPPAILVSS